MLESAHKIAGYALQLKRVNATKTTRAQAFVAPALSNLNQHNGGAWMADSHYICVVDGCDKDSRALGLCWNHYSKMRKALYPKNKARKPRKKSPQVELLEATVAFPPVGCVVWPFSVATNGYGRITYKGKEHRAHRLALKLYAGDPPSDDMHAAHEPITCHNPLCINPAHLRWATAKENAQDRIIDGTTARIGRFGGGRKLNKQKAAMIRRHHARGKSVDYLAKEYGVTKKAINKVLDGETYPQLRGFQ